MAFSVGTLVDYVIENTDVLVVKSIFGSRTSDLIRSEGTVLTAVKFAEQINILDSDAIFQDGSGCTRTSSGTTTVTQRKVTVGEVAVVEDLCVKALRKKYLSKALAKGSNENDIPFEKDYTDLKARTIAKQVEIALWQGDTTSLNANLNKWDGLIKLIDNAATSVNANGIAYNSIGTILTASGTANLNGINSTNVKEIVNSMWLALPSDVTGQDDIRIFAGWDVFNKFINAFTNQNLFNFAPTGSEVSAENGVVLIPGTKYKLTAVHGLDGTNRLFGIRMSNIWEGTDLEDEEKDWSIMEDQFKDYLRFKVQFKMGVNVAFPNEITSFKLV